MPRLMETFAPIDFTDPSAFPQISHNDNSDRFSSFGLSKPSQSVDQSTKQLIQTLADVVASKQTGLLQPSSSNNQSSDTLVPYRPVSYLDSHVSIYETFLNQLDSTRGQAVSSINQTNQTFSDSIHNQWSTFVLCHHLHLAKQQIKELNLSKSSSSQSRTVTTASREFRYSNLNAISYIIESSPELLHAHAVTAWLEEVAADVVVESRGRVEFKRTLRKLQLTNTNDVLSIDCVNLSKERGYAHVDANDIQEENTLLRCVWQHIRAGKINEAIELCSEFEQSWRAASLSGARPWDQSIVDGHFETNGNRKHFLWKHTCRAIASSTSVSVHERAIYGLLGSTLGSAFLVAQSWEDAVWASFRVSLDLQIDAALCQLIKDRHEKTLAEQQMKASASVPRNADAIFRQFSDITNSHVPQPARASHREFYHQLQCMLILDRVDEAEQLLSTAASGHSNKKGDFLVFGVHLYLYLHPDCPEQPLNSNGLTLVKALIEYLISSQQYSFVPFYASLLTASHQTEVYCKFLQSITPDQQSIYISMARSVFGQHALNIVKAFVSASFTGPNAVSDQSKIRVLDSYELLREGGSHGTAVQQATVYDANRLMRLLISENHFSSAQQLMKAVSMKRLDEVIGLKSKDQWDDNEVEFNGWALYVRVVHLFSLWQAHAATKPIKPVPLKSVNEHALTQQQQIVQKQKFTRLMNEYHTQSEQWSKLATEIGTTAVSALFECLQHADRGFLCHVSNSTTRSAEDAAILVKLRARLVPELLLMLHRTCDESGLASQSLQIVNLIVDERYQLYVSMTLDERRTMLALIKNSFVRYELDRSFQQNHALRDSHLDIPVLHDRMDEQSDDEHAQMTSQQPLIDIMQDEDQHDENQLMHHPVSQSSPRSDLLNAPLGAIDEQSTDILPEDDQVAESELQAPRRSDSMTSVNSNDSNMVSESEAEYVNEAGETVVKPKRRRARKDSQPRPTEVRRSSRLRKES